MRARRLITLLDWSAARPDYAAGLRAATATVVPLAIGEATGRPQLLWVALGGWLATFADPGGPYPLRAATLLAYALAGAASTVAATAVVGHPWTGVAALFVWAAGCALLRVYGEAAGGVGTLSLIAYCIALGTPATDLRSLALRGVLFAAGALWATALALMLWPVHPYRPVRRAVADCHRALAAQVRQLGAGQPGWFEVAARGRAQIRALLEPARSVLGSVRRGRRGESRRGELLVALYEAAELALGDLSALAETLLSLEERDEARPASFAPGMANLALALESTAKAVEEDGAVATPVVRPTEGELGVPFASLLSHVQFALEAAASLHAGTVGIEVSQQLSGRSARRSIRDVLSPRSIELRHALRVGATAAAAALLGLALHRARRYWIILTTIIVIQPHSGATLRRVLQRVAGTVFGAMLAALLAPLVHGQLRAALVLFALALAAAAFRRHNYAVYAALMTPLFLLLAETASGDWHLAGTRITSTLLGGLVALAGSFTLWPHRERDRLPAILAQVLRATRKLLLNSAQQGSLSYHERREVGLALANADAAFERFLDEAHTDAEAEAMMAVRSQSRRLVGAIVALSAGGNLPLELAREVGIALEALASAAEERRPPPALPSLPEGASAARILGPVEVIQAALARLAEAHPERPNSPAAAAP